MWLSHHLRFKQLLAKYGDPDLVAQIMSKRVTQGMTSEMVLDSLGRPADVNQKVLKTKKKEVWKYGHKGGNRYSTRIILEDDEVVGWDQK